MIDFENRVTCPECNAQWRDNDGYGVNLVGLEDPWLYDGVSFWQCTKCMTTWDRFTGELVSHAEMDRRHNDSVSKWGEENEYGKD